MDIEALREQNKQQAQREAEAGPARAQPDAAPIGDAILDFHHRGALSFAIPAHRSATGDVGADAEEWTGRQAFAADIAMTDGVDTRTQAWQVAPTAMQLFAQAIGADETLFATNGSTENVHVALLAAARPGETIAVARNGHKSIFSGLVLSGVRPVYVDAVYDDRWRVAHGVEPDELARVLDAHPAARAVLIATPTYYGVSADVKGLADVCHDRDIPLLVDDAWGLGYHFSDRLPPSILSCGADLVIGSVHKTLSGFSQASVLSVQGDRIDTTRLQLAFELEQSTSASSLLMSSIDAARRQFQLDGERLLGRAIDEAMRVRAVIEELPGLDLMRDDVVGPGATALDPRHVTFDVLGLGLTGFAAGEWLRHHHRIHVALADHRRLMVLITYADSEANVDRLIAALRALVDAHRGAERVPIPHVPPTAELRMETVMTPREAYLGQTEMVPWREAPGRVSAEMVCPYPPGIPVTAPGERLTGAVIDYLEQLAATGVMVEGAADQSLEQLRVVAR